MRPYSAWLTSSPATPPGSVPAQPVAATAASAAPGPPVPPVPGDDEDMSPGPEAKRARIAKVTGVDVPVGNGKLTMYHSDEYLSECANDVAVADPFCNEDDSDEGPVSDDEDSSALNGAPPLELFFPFSTSDPELSESEMSHLAHVADQHEIARLERMGVLKPLEGDTAHYSQLSTRFVRSFRPKPHPVTKAPSLLYRSRLVAREYKRCDPFRDDLYSPASQAILNRVLSALRQSYGTTGAILLAADIADAYFTVAQEKPTVVTSMTVRVA